MKIYSISKDDTNLIKGFAIFCIVFHNFFHWLPPMPGENEFGFSANRIFTFFSQIASNPAEIINILFSYLGHFGVQLFIFISGYGLALSMMKRSRSWGIFVLERLKKIYPLLLTGLIFLFFSNILFKGELLSDTIWRELKKKLLFVHILYPNSGLEVNGPWWFFGLIVQLYILFPLIFRCIQKWNLAALGIIAIVSYTWIFISQYFAQSLWEVPLMENAPGHIVEFSFGIWFALNKDKKLSWIFFVIAVALFCLGNFHKCFYPFTFISIVVIFIFVFRKITSISLPLIGKFFGWLGSISMVLFATHSLFREPFLQVGNNFNNALGHLFSGLLFFIFVLGIAVLAKIIYDWISSLFDKIPLPSKESKLCSTIAKILLILFYSYIVIFYTLSVFKPTEKSTDIISTPQKTENTLLSNNKFDTFTECEIPRNTHVIDATISFDVADKDVSQAPYIVFQIRNHVWDKVELPQPTENPDGSHTVTLEHSIYASFSQALTSKQLQIYFYNSRGGEIKYSNLTTKIRTR